MERTYYTINEQAARTAHNMMSFSEYREGSKTQEYRGYVDRAFDLADSIAESKPERAEQVYSMAARYSRKMAEYFNKDSQIGMMCPSVMISGAGNFPVRKKEKQNAAWERNNIFYHETQGILNKMRNIKDSKEQIKCGDADAIERLEEKLISLKELQESMKAVNKALRLKNTDQGDEELRNMGYSDEQIKQFREPDFCGRIGFPDYALQNNNANIHRVEERLNSIKKTKENGTQEKEYKGFKVVENTEIMRLQIFFDEKPEVEVRDLLKTNGFRFAPSTGAWQRQLTRNAQYSCKRFLDLMEFR